MSLFRTEGRAEIGRRKNVWGLRAEKREESALQEKGIRMPQRSEGTVLGQ